MRSAKINFIDTTFGEPVECLIIWDDEEFIIISMQNEEILIKKYKEMDDFIKEFITNKSELDFLRNLTVEQEKDIEELEEQLKWKKYKERH
ncbi:MAG: hypothetical protein HP028_00350 [Clostridia bacterium]|nr:hypothetical protein [Clostridia bacterium]